MLYDYLIILTTHHNEKYKAEGLFVEAGDTFVSPNRGL